jgi:hypothetical protein
MKLIKKIFKIIAALLLIGCLALLTVAFIIDKEHTDLAEDWVDMFSTSEVNSVEDWNNPWLIRVAGKKWTRFITIKGDNYLLIVDNEMTGPYWISLVHISGKGEGRNTGASTYFSSKCTPNFVIQTSKKYSDGSIRELSCSKNGLWLRDSVSYEGVINSFNMGADGFSASFDIYSDGDELERRNTLSNFTSKVELIK